jgi:chromosome segregation ATPase
MTLRYDHLLKENQQLNQSLSKMSSDMELNSKRLQCLEREAMKAEERAREACNNAGTIEETANFQIKECEKAMDERTAYVVALLMKLLSLEEEAKEMRKQVEEGRKRNEELMCKLRELTQNFDQEQRKSLKMSQTLARQQRSVKSAEDLSNRNRELQFISQKLQIEKDQAISELNELKSWAEALKARHDIMEKNKQQTQESYENVAVDCSLFR